MGLLLEELALAFVAALVEEEINAVVEARRRAGARATDLATLDFDFDFAVIFDFGDKPPSRCERSVDAMPIYIAIAIVRRNIIVALRSTFNSAKCCVATGQPRLVQMAGFDARPLKSLINIVYLAQPGAADQTFSRSKILR